MSKSAQKNRRKKQQQQRSKQHDGNGQSQEQRDAVSMATHLMGGASEGVRSEGGTSDGGDREKKIKNLKKVCGKNFKEYIIIYMLDAW